MASDYYGHAVESDGPLAEALEAAIPGRFQRLPTDVAIDHPWGYGRALLEGAVAAATLARQPYETSSASVQHVIDSFIEKIRTPPATTVLQVVADIDVDSHLSEGESLRFGGVEIVPVANDAEECIEQELMSAGYDVERVNVINSPGPTSLLVARVSDAISINARSQMAHGQIWNLMTAIRLATGATASPLVTIEGEPGWVRTVSPRIEPHALQLMRLGNRAVTLGKGHVAGIEALACRVDDWFGGDQLETNPLQIAIGRLNRSIGSTSTIYADVVTDLAIGLESALAGSSRSEVSLRLRTRAADLLANDTDPSDRVYQDVKQLYQLRSDFVHGRALRQKDFEKAISGVSSASRSEHFGERIELVLDRWRDILRRAILARAALSADSAYWPYSSNLDIEYELRSPSKKGKWLEQIRGYWTDVGLGAALESAPPWQLRHARA